jgi:hypothetical protein
MVAAGGSRLSDLAQHLVPIGSVRRGEVGEGGEGAITPAAQGHLAIAQFATSRRELGELFALLGRRGSATTSTRAILLGSELLELGGDRAPSIVKLKHAIDRLGQPRVTPGERFPDRFGVASDQSDVENAAPPPGSLAAATTLQARTSP